MPTTLDPPLPLSSEELAATLEVIVYEFELIIEVILYSMLRIAAVITPPKLTAPEKVTKSFTFAP